MSSLAATQADGYYLPVEYFESGAYKKQSKNQWANNNHHRGGRPSTSTTSTSTPPVVRFELPYSGSCQQCGHFILRGTRYNAVKTSAGNYYSTTVWEFRMKCRNGCTQQFVVRTNPKEQSFDYVSGITKQQRNLPENNKDDDDNNSSDEEQEEILLAQLESVAKGQRKVMTERDQLEAMQKSSTSLYWQDASRNAAVRAKFRVDRNDRKRRRKEAEALGYREGISLLDATVEDQVQAKETTFGDGRAKERTLFGKARASSIFASSGSGGGGGEHPKKTLAKKKKRKRTSSTAPDTVSSSTTNIVAAAKKTKVAAPIKKKILVVGSGKPSIMEAPKKLGSALEALADYGSDSS